MEAFISELDRVGLLEFYSLLVPTLPSPILWFRRARIYIDDDDSKPIEKSTVLVAVEPYMAVPIPQVVFRSLVSSIWVTALNSQYRFEDLVFRKADDNCVYLTYQFQGEYDDSPLEYEIIVFRDSTEAVNHYRCYLKTRTVVSAPRSNYLMKIEGDSLKEVRVEGRPYKFLVQKFYSTSLSDLL